MTLVCATHFTDTSFSAVKVAAELARRHHLPLWLVSVLPDAAHAPAVEAATRDALLLEVAALTTPELTVQSAVLCGPIEQALGQFCRDKKARLLVVGDTAGKIGPVLEGTLDKLVDAIEVPMLVVRDPKPFAAWAEGAGPLKVMLALDHTFASSVARDWIARLAEYGALDLVAAHVWWPDDEYARRGLVAPAGDEAHVALTEKLLTEARNALGGLPANVAHRVQLELGQGTVGAQLLAMAERLQANVFVLGTHADRGPFGKLGSVAHDVLANALMSVVCVPGHTALPRAAPSERPTAPRPT